MYQTSLPKLTERNQLLCKQKSSVCARNSSDILCQYPYIHLTSQLTFLLSDSLLLSLSLSPPHVFNILGDPQVLQEVCGPKQAITQPHVRSLPIYSTFMFTLNLSITGVLNMHNTMKRRRRRKKRTIKLYQASPEALIQSFVLRLDEWMEGVFSEYNKFMENRKYRKTINIFPHKILKNSQ